MLCGLSIITPLVLPPQQSRGYSPPGSFVALHCCCGLPQLTVMLDDCCSTIAGGVFRCSARSSWTSAVTSPQAPSLGLGLLVSCIAPAVCTVPPEASLFIRKVLFPPCGLTGAPFTLCFSCFTLSAKMIKEAFVETADSLFQDIKNKPEVLSSIKVLQLLRSTVTQRCEAMAEDLTQQRQREIADCKCFSLQLDKSTDTSDTDQMCISIQVVFTDIDITAHERTHARRGHFSVIQKLCLENHQLPVCKLCTVLMAVCHLCALLLSIFMCSTKGYTTLSISVMHCVR